MPCPACAAEVDPENLFCESCGHRMGSPTQALCACGGTEIDHDGFCTTCGRRLTRPPEDHIVLTLAPTFAGLSDRGLHHDRNEDRFTLGQTPAGAHILVVCDGVSATRLSERASASVSTDLLAALLTSTAPDVETAMREALATATANLTTHAESGDEAPSTTVVAALVVDNIATIAWAGDSRAYWFPAQGLPLQLTRDHSWVNDSGLPREQAEADPRAHAITRWLGADSAHAGPPELLAFPIPGPGALLLCTDGLWNYADTPEALARAAAPLTDDAPNIAHRLIAFANAAGGRDNITAALLQLA